MRSKKRGGGDGKLELLLLTNSPSFYLRHKIQRRRGAKRRGERVEGEGKAIVPHVSHTEKNLLSVKSTLGLAEVNPAMECPQ